jgi:hypothetical protein
MQRIVLAALIAVSLPPAARAADQPPSDRRCDAAVRVNDYAKMATACASAARDYESEARAEDGIVADLSYAMEAVCLSQAAVGNHHRDRNDRAVAQLLAARRLYARIHARELSEGTPLALADVGIASVDRLLQRYRAGQPGAGGRAVGVRQVVRGGNEAPNAPLR